MTTENNYIDWLKTYADQKPDAVAVRTSEKVYTYSEFNVIVDKYADYFFGKNIKEKDHCAIVADNSIEYITTVYALWRLGAVPIPMNIRLKNDELENQIRFADAKFIILHNDCKNNYRFNESEIIHFPFPDTDNELKHINRFSFENIPLILFTSGSTDNPKAVLFSFSNLVFSAANTIKLADAGVTDSWLASLPFYHIGGFMIIVRAFMKCGTIIIPDSLGYENVALSIKQHSPSIISFVSTQLHEILKRDICPRDNFKALFLGGGAIDSNLITEAGEKGWKIIKVYGSTETSSMITALDLRNGNRNLDSAGREITKNSVSISGNNRKGEIVIECESVAKCYYKNSDERLLNGKFYSNDFGYLDDDEYLYIEGRIDDIIISGGENINSNEITRHLLRHPSVSDAYTFGLKNDKWGEAVTSVVVLKKSDVTEAEIFEFLKPYLPSIKIPKRIIFAEEIPRTGLGKVRKLELFKSLKLY